MLSGFFFLLSLLAYTRHVRSLSPVNYYPSTTAGKIPWSSWPYRLALVWFALGLMTKPMIVTLPCLLLLLDFWPFQRLDLDQLRAHFPALLYEKIPFFALSMVASFITYYAQGNVIGSVAVIPLWLRLANGVLAYFNYLWQTFWPFDLAVFYPPYRDNLPWASTVVAIGVLLVVTLFVLARLRRRPFLATGWFWFTGMLVPVSGIVMPGEMIQSDHFTYLPSIGLTLMLVWGLGTLVEARPALRAPMIGLGTAAVLALCFVSHRQVEVWRDTRTLFTHAAAVTKNNFVAHSSLANLEIGAGRYDAAITNLQAVLQYAPGYPLAEYLMGTALQMQGHMAEAIPHLEAASSPDVRTARDARLILSYLATDRLTEADDLLGPFMRLRPLPPEVAAMGAIRMKAQGSVPQALQLFRPVAEANLSLQADTPYFAYQLAELHGLLGQDRKAAEYYDRAVTQWPSYTNALNDFAWLLATSPDDTVRNGPRAVELASRACQLTGEKIPVLLGTLAAAYAEAGRFPEAMATTERARDLARQLDQLAVALRNADLLELYRSGKPYRETGP